MKCVMLIILLLPSILSFSQKISFKPKLKVYINDQATKEFQVRFLDPEKDTLMKAESHVFDTNGTLLTYQLNKKINWDKSKILHKDEIGIPSLIKSANYLFADIKPEEERLLVYFWPFTKGDSAKIKAATDFFEKNQFSIKLHNRTSLSFKTSISHAGILTLPLKVFLGVPDSVSAVQAAASVGLYIGRKWSKTNYVKLPNEKEFASSVRGWSANIVAGFNQLELKEENTKDKGAMFKGSVTSISIGVAGGYHFKTFTSFLATGLDIPLSNKASNWSFKNKPWIGFGAGFEIF